MQQEATGSTLVHGIPINKINDIDIFYLSPNDDFYLIIVNFLEPDYSMITNEDEEQTVGKANLVNYKQYIKETEDETIRKVKPLVLEDYINLLSSLRESNYKSFGYIYKLNKLFKDRWIKRIITKQGLIRYEVKVKHKRKIIYGGRYINIGLARVGRNKVIIDLLNNSEDFLFIGKIKLEKIKN